jgi:RNA polymerase sigma-70 factor, ECF subfamily
MARPKTGEERAFIEAFDQYGDALLRHCTFRISSRDRALELVQDAFMKTWKYIVGGGIVENYRAFLYKTVNNLVIDEYRKRSVSSLDALWADGTKDGGAFEELVGDGMAEVEVALDAERVMALLDELSSSYRDVITMRYIDDMSPTEIAELSGESENVISVRIHRGMKQLKKIAEEKYNA